MYVIQTIVSHRHKGDCLHEDAVLSETYDRKSPDCRHEDRDKEIRKAIPESVADAEEQPVCAGQQTKIREPEKDLL